MNMTIYKYPLEMNMTIYKYPLDMDHNMSVTVPVGARLLDIQVQNDVPTLWCLIDSDEKQLQSESFRMFGTGHPVDISDSKFEFLRTLQFRGGSLVFHFFWKSDGTQFLREFRK